MKLNFIFQACDNGCELETLSQAVTLPDLAIYKNANERLTFYENRRCSFVGIVSLMKNAFQAYQKDISVKNCSEIWFLCLFIIYQRSLLNFMFSILI